MYKHLFVPVDGSSLSHRAMDGSIELALQLQARITGFVVEPDLPLSVSSRIPEDFSHQIKDHESKNQLHSQALLGQFAERAMVAGVPFSGLTVTAYGVEEAIMEQAEKSGCDMIVMVTHGRSAIGEFIFGSHTRKIVGKSRLPVFVLHE